MTMIDEKVYLVGVRKAFSEGITQISSFASVVYDARKEAQSECDDHNRAVAGHPEFGGPMEVIALGVYAAE
jgi:hypothetical protein